MDRKHILSKTKGDLAYEGPLYIGIGEVGVGHVGDVLNITALGSCIGLVIYPRLNNLSDRCAVMGHIMLPESPKHVTPKDNRWGPAKYADRAVPFLINILEKEGFNRKLLQAKIVGGARLFGTSTLSMKIGENNAKTVKSLLKQEEITLLKSFTGGDTGMSLSFNVSEYLLTVKPTGGSKIVI